MPSKPKKVLIYGIQTTPGQQLLATLRRNPDAYEVYGLVPEGTGWSSAQRLAGRALPKDRWRVARWNDERGLRAAVHGIDALVHAAGPFSEQQARQVTDPLARTRQLLLAAQQQGVPRVVLASTVFVLWGATKRMPYRAIVDGRPDELPSMWPLLAADAPAEPVESWASTRVWEEALLKKIAEQDGISTVCVRMGQMQQTEPKGGRGSVWCSMRDAVGVLQCAVDEPIDGRHVTVAGISANRDRWIDVQQTGDVLGYIPRDQAGRSAGAGSSRLTELAAYL